MEILLQKMAKLAKEITDSCKICSAVKYDRSPRQLGENAIPETLVKILHFVIFLQKSVRGQRYSDMGLRYESYRI